MLDPTCTVCGISMPGFPDGDITCEWCERTNFSGDPLRQPGRPSREPEPWWRRERLPLAPRRDGLRALTFVQGPWVWSDEGGIEERTDV
jgi:hypothetical protein